jgi:hypothetical protein
LKRERERRKEKGGGGRRGARKMKENGQTHCHIAVQTAGKMMTKSAMRHARGTSGVAMTMAPPSSASMKRWHGQNLFATAGSSLKKVLDVRDFVVFPQDIPTPEMC